MDRVIDKKMKFEVPDFNVNKTLKNIFTEYLKTIPKIPKTPITEIKTIHTMMTT